MKNILDEILEVKKKEVEDQRFAFDEHFLRNFISLDYDRKCFSLKENLLKEGSTGIIAEYKRKSPSKGWFDEDGSAAGTVFNYEQYGAAGASVLTDKTFFGGDIYDLDVTRAIVNIPLLRKDFILDEIQIQFAKACGADVILLIAAILSPERTKELAIEAKRLGMEVLLEIHSEKELGHICEEIDMVGVNNRDLKDFSVDVNRSIQLGKLIPVDKIKISESGISDVKTIHLLREHGFKGFLIGEAFMKENDPSEAFKNFINKLKA